MNFCCGGSTGAPAARPQKRHKQAWSDRLKGLRADLEAVEDDQLHVVVTLADQHLAVAVGSGLDGGGRIGQRHQCDRALIHHSAAGALQQRQDDFDVLALLVGVAAADLADQLQHCHLQDVTPVRHIVHLCTSRTHLCYASSVSVKCIINMSKSRTLQLCCHICACTSKDSHIKSSMQDEALARGSEVIQATCESK